MESLTLKEICGAVGGKLCGADENTVITSISTDSRDIPKDCLFIAIKGERFDGHDFLHDAVRLGAAAVVSEREADGVPAVICQSTRKALLDIAAYYRKKMPVKVVGITGSVGKTTTKEMTALALSAGGKTMKTEGNLNNEIGLPKTLFRLDSSIERAVIEMGMSGFGEIDRLSKTASPDIAMITNIGMCHLEQLGSQDNILKAKLEILNGSKPNCPLIVNGDDVRLAPLKEKLSDRNVITFGIDNKCDLNAENIRSSGESTVFDIVLEGKSVHCVIPCIGKHNVYDALAAVAAAYVIGDDIVPAANALKDYVPSGMRQHTEKIGGFTALIDCYNASPTSMQAAINTLCEMKCDGRRGAVLADMLELGEMSPKLHEDTGKYAAGKKLDFLVCYGEMSKHMAEGAEKSGLHAEWITDSGKLAEYLKEHIKDGDTVLFKGSRGMKLEKIIGELREGRS